MSSGVGQGLDTIRPSKVRGCALAHVLLGEKWVCPCTRSYKYGVGRSMYFCRQAGGISIIYNRSTLSRCNLILHSQGKVKCNDTILMVKVVQYKLTLDRFKQFTRQNKIKLVLLILPWGSNFIFIFPFLLGVYNIHIQVFSPKSPVAIG